MHRTLALAEHALEHGELPIAALVVLDGAVIAQAHTAERREGRMLVHAELLALEQADRLQPFPGNRRNAVLYTNLEPCLMCLGAATSFMLGAIYYALESPSDGAASLVQTWQRDEASYPGYRAPALHSGLLRKQSIALFQNWTSIHPPEGPMWHWAKSLADLA
jgi:tRNA(adenine34) deaminase